jgi:hypothetical protein
VDTRGNERIVLLAEQRAIPLDPAESSWTADLGTCGSVKFAGKKTSGSLVAMLVFEGANTDV